MDALAAWSAISEAFVTARRGLLAAIAVGMLFGALSCPVGMATAGGHGAHPSVTGVDVDRDASSHDAHRPPGSGDELRSPERSDGDDVRAAADQGHPGSACVTTIRLRLPDPVALTRALASDAPPAVVPPDCVTEPDPPVPRRS